MNCCIDCFRDAHIRTIIEKHGVTGNCDICPSNDVFIYDVDISENPIADLIIGLVQSYSVSDNPDAKLLKMALCHDWDIFNIESDLIQKLTIKLCGAGYPSDADIFLKNTIIPQLLDDDFLNEVGVVSGQSWREFSESIKYKNRFHSGFFNADAFASFLSIATKSIPAGSKFFRARISSNNNGFQSNDMGAPPMNQRSAGRINPEGIGILYLSSDEITVLKEVRASSFDFITIGEFENTRDIHVVDLSGVARTSPFLYPEGADAFAQFAANRRVFQEIAAEIAKPLRRNDSPIEYLPTQFISEFIKNQNYDGVEYASTLNDDGYNLAVFDEALFTCDRVKTIEVTEVSYQTDPGICVTAQADCP